MSGVVFTNTCYSVPGGRLLSTQFLQSALKLNDQALELTNKKKLHNKENHRQLQMLLRM